MLNNVMPSQHCYTIYTYVDDIVLCVKEQLSVVEVCLISYFCMYQELYFAGYIYCCMSSYTVCCLVPSANSNSISRITQCVYMPITWWIALSTLRKDRIAASLIKGIHDHLRAIVSSLVIVTRKPSYNSKDVCHRVLEGNILIYFKFTTVVYHMKIKIYIIVVIPVSKHVLS